MKNAEITNDFIISISNWLKPREKFAQKLFSQQCLRSMEHDAFKAEMKKLKGDDNEEPVEAPIEEKKDDKDQVGNDAEEPKPEPVEIEEEFKINYDDFKLGNFFNAIFFETFEMNCKRIVSLKVLIDLDISCTNVKLHVICKLLDTNSLGFIDYRNFTPEFIRNGLK
jgi:hypothetical protein